MKILRAEGCISPPFSLPPKITEPVFAAIVILSSLVSQSKKFERDAAAKQRALQERGLRHSSLPLQE
ncbi:hypothetical protein L6164_036176 [Bauhinia variegata]|uniref:Uncharacterized protein n=1 Tax=Bauhinia variegata TaxID=167791 RepID=A0ACB9KG63_BAUVA|nr:hypothetical protein L6164_036176 [Bauhinia variegata]